MRKFIRIKKFLDIPRPSPKTNGIRAGAQVKRHVTPLEMPNKKAFTIISIIMEMIISFLLVFFNLSQVFENYDAGKSIVRVYGNFRFS